MLYTISHTDVVKCFAWFLCWVEHGHCVMGLQSRQHTHTRFLTKIGMNGSGRYISIYSHNIVFYVVTVYVQLH